MKSILLTLLFVGVGISAFGQANLTGRVFDQGGVAIKEVSIRILSWPDSIVVMEGKTANDGLFSLQVSKKGDYKIHYSSVGYRSEISRLYTIGHDNITAVPIFLVNDTQVIDAVEVKGKLATIRQYADKMVVDVAGTVLAEGNNVLELLEKTPGVIGDGKGNFSIQGRTGAKVRIDGREVYVSGDQLAGILRGLQASDVEKLELMSNPSAREDASGTAGIINIVTKRNAKLGFGGDVYARGSQGRRFYGGLGGGVHYKVNGLDMYLQGNKSYDRNQSHNWAERSFYEGDMLKAFQKQAEKKQLDDGAYNSVRGGAKYTFNDGGVLDGSIHWMRGNYKPTAEADIESWSYPSGKLLSRGKSKNQFDETFKNWTFNLNYLNKYKGEDHFLKVNVDFAPHGNDYNNRFESAITDLETNKISNDGRVNIQDLSNTTYAGRLDYSKPLSESNKIELGWKGTYFFINNDVQNIVLKDGKWDKDVSKSNRFQYTQHIEALYAIYSGKYSKVEYQVGLRGEYTFIDANQLTLQKKNDQRYFDLFPSGSLLYHLNADNTVRGSFSSRIERPGDHDINVFRVYEDAYNYNEGNPNLKPEKSYITELGHGFKNKLFTTLGLSYGRDIINWIIRAGDQEGESLSRPENIGRYINYSASVMYNQSIASYWTASHYVNTFYNDYTGDIEGVNLNSKGASWTANSRHTLLFKHGFRAELSLYYRSGITTGAQRTNERYGVDLAAEKKLFGERAMIKLAVNGLIRNANPRLTSDYGNLHIYYADYPDNRKAILSVSYRFGS